MVTAKVSMEFNQALSEYIRLSSKTQDEVLLKKGNDIRLRLNKGYRDLSWKEGKGGTAFEEMYNRAAVGKGIRVRKGLGILPRAPKRGRSGRLLTPHQRKVWSEITTRVRGIGVLGVSFIINRWRTHAKGGRYLVINKKSRSGFDMVRIEKTKDTFHIAGLTPGLKKVDERYGVVNTALREATADMRGYIIGKYKKAADKVFKRFLK